VRATRAKFSRWRARYGVLGAIALLPWLLAQLVLFWLIPRDSEIQGVRDGVSMRSWMLHKELDKLRLALCLLITHVDHSLGRVGPGQVVWAVVWAVERLPCRPR
jgi:hypothetical protein